MSQPILDLGNILNWDLLHRQKYLAQATPSGGFIPLSRVNVICSSNIIAAGAINTKGKRHWTLGAWLYPALLISPSDSSDFTAAMDFERYAVPLGRLKLIQMPKYQPQPYLLEFQIPRWHEELYLEVWYYSGEESTTVEEALKDTNTKLDTLLLTPPSAMNSQQILTDDLTVNSNSNQGITGPITVKSGVTIIVPSGSYLVIT